MKNNETGEFELVLGNRQLLSGFFVVVILFAVFFVMGYIVGRNSTPQVAANRDESSGAAARPRPAAPAPQNPSTAAAEPPKQNAGGNAPASEPAPATKTEAPTSATPAASTPVESAPSETYLQVTSVNGQDVAETVAKTLKDKGFPAVVSPGLRGQTRVLVGPYMDRGKLGQAKAELERLGFQPFVKK